MRPSTALGLLSCLAAFSKPAFAFLPTETRSLNGRLGVSHIMQTRIAIEALWGSLLNVTTGTSKMLEVREQIAEANADVDDDQEHAELHFDGESFIAGQQRLINLADNVVSYMKMLPSDGDAARKSLGQALHTLQDFYSHTNWIELLTSTGSALVPHPGLGVPGMMFAPLALDVKTCLECKNWPDCGDCKGNLVTEGLTSGYYSGEPEYPKPGKWKCSHGGPFDGSSGSIWSAKRGQGINKDSSDCTLSPHHHLHAGAVNVSITATKKYVTEICQRLTDDEVKLLFGFKTSTSIWALIPEWWNKLLNEAAKLVTDDHDKRDLTTRATATELNYHTFIAARDIHEHARSLAQHSASGKIHPIQVVPRDAAQNGTSSFGWDKVALATGGHILRVAANETEEARKFVEMVSQADHVEILSAAGTASEVDSIVEYSFPVDTTLESVLITAGGASSFELFFPNGSQFPAESDTENGVYVRKLSSNIAVNITTTPPAGTYRIVLHCASDYSLSVSGKSTISLSSFYFTKLGGRAGHEGYFPIMSSPLVGGVYPIQAYVDGKFSQPKFEFRTKKNELIAEQNFVQTGGEQGVGGKMFEGNTTAMPDRDFMVYFSGLDCEGQKYQRVLLNLVTPSKVDLNIPRTETLTAGKEKKIRVSVKNLNKISDSFTIFAVDEKKIISKVSKSTISLKAGATGYFDITLSPGKDITCGTNHMIVSVKGKKTKGNVEAMTIVIEPESHSEQPTGGYQVYYANETLGLIESKMKF
ncbi:hypothetical protein ABW19_dt0202791 [Dactylella cylindrospora]|nr:hypothetical protein ABW19_dt0202791 [Dactylella cylindrospora]